MLIFVAGCALLFSGSPARAASTVWEKNGPATVVVDAPVANGSVTLTLADVLTVTVRVDGPKTLEVNPPEPITKSAGWRLIEASPVAAAVDLEGRHWRQSFILEPLAPGELSLQIEPLLIRSQGDEFQKLSWRAVPVRVQTNITAAELGALRDPTVIESLPEPAEAEPPPWGWLGAGALLGLVALYLWRRRRRWRPSAMPAEARALRAIDRLLALRLPEQGKIERFHTLLANIVRRYLDRKLELSARRRTTREFLDVLRTSEKLADSQQEFLRDFFTRCDLAKFAGAGAAAADCADLAAQARAFIVAHAPRAPVPSLGQTAPVK
jgi:MYXO-CTERM domain-containing protein